VKLTEYLDALAVAFLVLIHVVGASLPPT
jgi:hypothetical protein